MEMCLIIFLIIVYIFGLWFFIGLFEGGDFRFYLFAWPIIAPFVIFVLILLKLSHIITQFGIDVRDRFHKFFDWRWK